MKWGSGPSIITVSDRGSRGEREDISGPEIARMLETAGMDIIGQRIIPDEKEIDPRFAPGVERQGEMPI